MEIFEKQQTIEAIKAVLKARTLFAFLVGIQVFALKAVAKGVSLTSGLVALSLVALVCIFNILCWLYIRRQPEKISSGGLQFTKVLQVAFDITIISLMVYLNGTTNTTSISFYLVVILGGSILYRKKGILFTALTICFIYSALVFLEYFGFFLYKPNPEALRLYSVEGNWSMAVRQLIGFNAYAIAAGIYAMFLAGVNVKRGKRLEVQRSELVEKTRILTGQKAELTQAQNLLKDALIKSDRARLELTKTKEELEEANLELRKKIEELEKFYRVTVGREVKMVELKSEIKNLKETIKKLKRQ